MKDEALAS